MNVWKFAFLVCVFALMPSRLFSQIPTVMELDGFFDDWVEPDLVVAEPMGDATGAFDISQVAAVTDGTTLYLRFDTGRTLNLQNGPREEGTLVLHLELPNDRELKINFRERHAMLSTPSSTSRLPWGRIRFATLPTHAANEFELRLDLNDLGIREGQTVMLNFSGSDSLSSPIAIKLRSRGTKSLPPIDFQKPTEAIRVASLNTLKQGSASKERSPSIRSLFKLADADIYCFNEALDEQLFRSTCANVLPPAFAKIDNVHWSATCGIVSKHPLTPLNFSCREAAALIQLPDGIPLVVVSVHFKCCGYAGSREDKIRISEVEALLSDLQRLRDGAFGARAASAGVVILGDFNLVGSRTPLDMINAAGFNDVLLRSPVDHSAMTWRGIDPREPFWPGRLDFAVVDSNRIEVRNGFLLNSEQLGKVQPDAAKEPLASDHAMLVVDLVTP